MGRRVGGRRRSRCRGHCCRQNSRGRSKGPWGRRWSRNSGRRNADRRCRHGQLRYWRSRFNFRYRGRRYRTRRRDNRRRHCRTLLFADDCFQHISWFRDMGQINLGLDVVCIGPGAASCLGHPMAFVRSAQVSANFLRLMLFERAGVRLLLGNPDFCKRIENGFALDFQLSRQIVNSNLAHPPLCPSRLFR